MKRIPFPSDGPRNKNDTIAGILVGAFIIISGGVTFSLSLNALWKAEASKKWTPVVGSAVNVKLISPRRGPVYRTIRYRYVYRGKSYENDRISYGRIIGGQHYVPESAGDPVTVYVNPNSPDESVLAPGIAEAANTCCAIGGGVSLCGLLVLVLTFRARPQELSSA